MTKHTEKENPRSILRLNLLKLSVMSMILMSFFGPQGMAGLAVQDSHSLGNQLYDTNPWPFEKNKKLCESYYPDLVARSIGLPVISPQYTEFSSPVQLMGYFLLLNTG